MHVCMCMSPCTRMHLEVAHEQRGHARLAHEHDRVRQVLGQRAQPLRPHAVRGRVQEEVRHLDDLQPPAVGGRRGGRLQLHVAEGEARVRRRAAERVGMLGAADDAHEPLLILLKRRQRDHGRGLKVVVPCGRRDRGDVVEGHQRAVVLPDAPEGAVEDLDPLAHDAGDGAKLDLQPFGIVRVRPTDRHARPFVHGVVACQRMVSWKCG